MTTPWFIEANANAPARSVVSSPHDPAVHPLRGIVLDDNLDLVALLTCSSKLAAEGILWHLHEQYGATMCILLDRTTHEFVAACSRPINERDEHA